VRQRTTWLCRQNHERTFMSHRANNIQPPPFSSYPKYAGQFRLRTSQVNVRYAVTERVTHRSATCVRMRTRNEGTDIHLNLVWSKCRYLHKTSMLSRHSQERDRLLTERQFNKIFYLSNRSSLRITDNSTRVFTFLNQIFYLSKVDRNFFFRFCLMSLDHISVHKKQS
jgi:hypothetical protein